MSVFRIADLYIGDAEVTYGDLREFVKLTKGNPDSEELMFDFDADCKVDSLRGFITEGE